MIAYVSHTDLPDIRATTRKSVLAAANAKRTVAVVVINQVAADGRGVIKGVPPKHLDFEAFYNYTKSVEQNYDPGQEVFAEVNAFLIDGEKARLVWSGTTWSFQADGAGSAIRGISETVANELRKVREQIRSY